MSMLIFIGCLFLIALVDCIQTYSVHVHAYRYRYIQVQVHLYRYCIIIIYHRISKIGIPTK